jgi:hypothetical protein
VARWNASSRRCAPRIRRYIFRVVWKHLLGVVAVVTSGCAGFVPSGHTANELGNVQVETPRWALKDGATDAPSCRNQPYDFLPSGRLRHTRNDLFVAIQGEARTHGRDAIVKLGSPARVEAKFSYGPFAKDLEDEDVSLFVRGQDCAWTRVGSVRTDDRGIATFEVPAAVLSKAGAYAFEAVLNSDGEAAPGAIYVIDGKTKAVVFDVDETLTIGDGELVEQLAFDADPEMRTDASKIVREWARAGWFVTYLTGRPHQLTDITRNWLDANGFPKGLLRTSESFGVSMSGDATQLYKATTLKALTKTGLDLRFAYGNATTDICAYSSAGIDPLHTFIVGPHAGKGCPGAKPTVALASYTAQLGAPILRLAGASEAGQVAAR